MRTYIAIDLKSFYASVECVEHGFDPLKTNLVVADESRTEKTICLAVSPSLKAYGIGGRSRLYEVVQQVNKINMERRHRLRGKAFRGDSFYDDEVQKDPYLALSYFVAKPRMAYYMNYSNKIYQIYLKYVAEEDIHVYSIDEVFIDATAYLHTYKMTANQFAMMMINDVYNSTGITATAGIGPNLYLCKIAMDIVAKKKQPDENGVRIAQINEREFRELLWDHTPLTDFWRIGKGISNKLNAYGMYTMGDIALNSLKNENLLYHLFGINAELLIDHAWGYEPVGLAEIKAYRPNNNSLSSGQVLKEPYKFAKALLVAKEMADSLSLDLVDKGLKTNQIVLSVGYDISNIDNYEGELKEDYYGRMLPRQAHGSLNLNGYTSSTKLIVRAVSQLFEQIVDKDLTIRRMYVVASHVIRKEEVKDNVVTEQLDLFSLSKKEIDNSRDHELLTKEEKMQEAIIKIKKKYGKNAILKANNLEEGATMKERNEQIGGHKA